MIKQPRYSLTEDGLGRLDRTYVFQCPIGGQPCCTELIDLMATGSLNIYAGYTWDFGSGPAIDTPAVVYASLGHDVLYDLIGQGKLPKRYRKKADVWFKQLLKDAGMSWFRRQYMYLAVRYGYPLTQVFK